jgi:predicted CopG family antitoxin
MGKHPNHTSITVSKDTVKELKKTKRNGQSYSDVIAEMIAEKNRTELPKVHSLDNISMKELAKHSGQYIAVYEDKIIGWGDHEGIALEMAKKRMPTADPCIYGIPPKEGIIAGLQFGEPNS